MARRVPRGRDHLERADALTRLDGAVGLRLRPRVAATELVDRFVRIEAHVLGEQPGLARRDDHFRIRQPFLERVERADVVRVRVGQRDADDRSAGRLGRRDDLAGGAADHRVDQREAVVLRHQVGVDEAQAG